MGSGEGSGGSSGSTLLRSLGSLQGLWSGDMESGWWEGMWTLRAARGNPLAEDGFPLGG